MSKVNFKPEGFHSVTPYLTVKGAAKLLDFMKQAFGAEELGRHLEPSGRIAHASVRIGDSMVELSDGTDKWPPMASALHLYVPDVDATHKRAVLAGGTSLHEPMDQFYGDRTGTIEDPFGHRWNISHHVEDVSVEEMKRRMAAAKK